MEDISQLNKNNLQFSRKVRAHCSKNENNMILTSQMMQNCLDKDKDREEVFQDFIKLFDKMTKAGQDLREACSKFSPPKDG